MQKRKLGKSGIEVPPIVFGGNVLGWTMDEAASFKVLDALVDAGFNAIDTADVYSVWVPGHKGGESETVLGHWLKRRGGRDKVVIATKCGMKMGSGDQGLSPGWIARAVEDSLKRLGTDYVDLYQAHRDDETTPIEDTLGAYDKLIKAGKVRAIGASNYTAARLKQALETSRKHGLPRYESLQPHYNMLERRLFEPELAPLCQAEGIGAIVYYPLASGYLSGKYRSEADLKKSPRGGVAKKYMEGNGPKVLKALDAVAARYKATPTEVTVAWTIAQPAVTAPIVSATSVEQLRQVLKGAELKLDKDAIAQLNAASA